MVYFGAPGSYSEQAMEECFGEEVTSFPAATFKEVMAAVRDNIADFGVLPIENTTTGGITDSYDLMVDFDNYIVGEHVLKINQALLGKSSTLNPPSRGFWFNLYWSRLLTLIICLNTSLAACPLNSSRHISSTALSFSSSMC